MDTQIHFGIAALLGVFLQFNYQLVSDLWHHHVVKSGNSTNPWLYNYFIL